MKRICSALLTAALCLSLAVPASAADATTFTDAKNIQHWEAVAALTQMDFFSGKPDGSFDPTALLSRAECAKLLSVFTHGRTTEPSPSDGYLFNDIYDHWARTYIRDAVSSAYLYGRGDGSFDPDGTVTSLELTRGIFLTFQWRTSYDYIPHEADYPEWSRLANELADTHGLFNGVKEEFLPVETGDGLTAAPINRETAAQVFYNALSIVLPESENNSQPIPCLQAMFGRTEFPAIPTQPE